VLFGGASLERVGDVYQGNAVADYYNEALVQTLLACLRQRPAGAGAARLLEIGAGTGGTSALVFERLGEAGMAPAEYRYTDISRAFLLHAQDTFCASYPYVVPSLFDVERDPAGQGIAICTYDAVIATNVLHATRNIRRTLHTLKATQPAGGLLLVNEISESGGLFTHLTFGLLKGWWQFEDDALRLPGCPGLAPDAWARVLAQCGYRGASFPAADAIALGQQVIVAQSDGWARIGSPPSAPSASVRAQSPTERAAVPPPPFAAAPHTPLPPHRNAVREIIATQLAQILDIPRDDIAWHEPFADYGLDSINAGQLVQALNAALGTTLDTLRLFDFASIDRLAQHLLDVGVKLPSAEAVVPAAPASAPLAGRRAARRRAGSNRCRSTPRDTTRSRSKPCAWSWSRTAVVGTIVHAQRLCRRRRSARMGEARQARP
jgi:acyl carrier protein